jgi:hypothetical protein
MNAPVDTMPTTVSLSKHLENWERRVAKAIDVPTIWKRQAAVLLSAISPVHSIPAQTYRNWFYERRTPSQLAAFEIKRRALMVEKHITGETPVPALVLVIEKIQAEHQNGAGEED